MVLTSFPWLHESYSDRLRRRCVYDSRNLFYAWQIGKMTSYLSKLVGLGLLTRRLCSCLIGSHTSNITTIISEQIVKRFLFPDSNHIIRHAHAIILIARLPLTLKATTFHGLSCRRCTGHPSCCKRYRRDSNTDYIFVGQISNLLRFHYSTIPYANGRIRTHRPFGSPVFKTVCL